MTSEAPAGWWEWLFGASSGDEQLAQEKKSVLTPAALAPTSSEFYLELKRACEARRKAIEGYTCTPSEELPPATAPASASHPSAPDERSDES